MWVHRKPTEQNWSNWWECLCLLAWCRWLTGCPANHIQEQILYHISNIMVMRLEQLSWLMSYSILNTFWTRLITIFAILHETYIKHESWRRCETFHTDVRQDPNHVTLSSCHIRQSNRYKQTVSVRPRKQSCVQISIKQLKFLTFLRWNSSRWLHQKWKKPRIEAQPMIMGTALCHQRSVEI